MENGDFVEHVTQLGFAPTMQRVLNAIADAGLILFARIDHDEGARDIGLTMPPTTVLIYGHPKGGTPIMLATPHAALDLPLHVLVRQLDNGHTAIGFHPITEVLRRAGVPDSIAGRLQPAQDILVKAIS